MATEQKMVSRTVMKIEDIRKYENLLFWVERLAIATLIFFPTINSYLSNIAAFVLMNAVDPFYFLLTLERQQIRRFFFEPDLIFYVERVTIKYWLFVYYRDSGFAPGSGIALAIVIFTNLLMLKDRIKDLVKYLDKISSSSHSSNTTDAKETSMKIDEKKEENADVELLEKKVELKQKQKQEGEGEFVLLANKEESFTNDDQWFSDYLSVMDSSLTANGDKEEALPRSTTPTPNPYPIDSELPAISQGWFEEGPFFSGELPEHIEHSSASMEIQMEDQEEAAVAGSDSPLDNYLKEHLFCCDQIDLSLPNDEEEVEAKDEVQEAASSNYKSDGDSSWEEVQNSVDDGKLGAEIADNSDQKNDELEEAGEEEEATSSWEAGEIDLILRQRMQSEEERAERLHEEELAERLRGYEAMFLKAEQEKKDLTEKHEAAMKQYKENYSKLQKEVSVKCTDMITGLKSELLGVDIDKLQAKLDAANKQLEIYQVNEKEFEEERSRWDEEREDLYLKLDELDEFEEERLKWNEEKENLNSKLDAATKQLEIYQVNEKEFEEERCSWNEEREDFYLKLDEFEQECHSWDEEREDLHYKLDAATKELENYQVIENDFAVERLKWNEEKENLHYKLDAATKELENYQVIENDFAVERLKWNEEKENLHSKLDAATKELENYQVIENDFAAERLKWNEEKENLHSKLDAATALLQEERVQWEEEKGQLLHKLETTANGFAEEQGQWDEENRALLATITHADENVQYCQNLVNTLTKERDDLAARIDDEKSMVESYKGLYDQSEEHCQYYKACFEEYEQKYLKLKEENLDISAKLFTETSFAERYKKIVTELEDKCRRLEEEKNDVNAKLCAAKASSELYRSCLLDFF
ncbi:hypothetical protein CCACVL1_16639 [Corchorus capsularis]|uniref:Uncharacterized protein n=1 Tax=Corchorus capsularis TaxID=210143 RepID=A0A1R3HVX1_COCAP|nr:hypothetical protein CCACVL1_16639 [Corchorus capsularis]